MIRLATLSFLLSASGALACPMPQGAIKLVSQNPDAPYGYAEMKTPPLSAPFEIDITFCDSDGQAEDLEFDAVMPAHQHGMNFTVDVAKLGQNRFEVSNVVFHMPGLWELRIEAEIGNQSHRFTAEVPMK